MQSYMMTYGALTSNVSKEIKTKATKTFMNNLEKAIAKHKNGYVGLVTAISADDDIVTIASHGLLTNDPLYFTSTANGITAYIRYYAHKVNDNTFKLKASPYASEYVNITDVTAGQIAIHCNDANMLLIGDSNIEGAGVLLEQNATVNRLMLDLQTRQYGASTMEYLRFPSEENATYFIETGTWTDTQNDYCCVGKSMAGIVSSSLANRGWYKTVANGATLKIPTSGMDIRILVASDGVFEGQTAGSVTVELYSNADVLQHTETVDMSGSTLYKWIYPNMTNNAAGYYVLLTSSLGANQYLAVQCVQYFYSLFNRGLKVCNLGTSSSASYHWIARTSIFDAFNPACTLISLGGNDIAGAIADATYETNMTTLLNTLTAYGEVIMIFYSPWVTADASILAKIESYRTICENLSKNYDNVYFVDMHDILIDGATASAEGLLLDTVHANDKGHEVMYQYLKTKINL